MNNDIFPQIKAQAPLILAEIKKAKSILLHCHPSPDPDSVGSALAMKFVIEQLGGKATVIKGDNDIPQAFMHFPGAKDIVAKSWWEIDQSQFDLFIIVDSALNGVSRTKEMTMPTMKVINIDHHRSNSGSGSINLIIPGISSCAELLFRLFQEFPITLTNEIATNLFMGIYTDSGGLKYEGTTPDTYKIMGQLTEIVPEFPRVVSQMENSHIPEEIYFQAIALSSVELFLGNELVISGVSYDTLIKNNLQGKNLGLHFISSILKSVIGWNITAAIVEAEPHKIKISFRTRDAVKYDLSKIAMVLGGGGHKAAAGATLNMSLDDAKKLVVAKAKEMYNI